MSTRYPKKAVTPRVGDQRAGEPKQSPTQGSFAGLVSLEEVIAKPRTLCPPCGHECNHPCEEYFEYADKVDTNPRAWEPGEF